MRVTTIQTVQLVACVSIVSINQKLLVWQGRWVTSKWHMHSSLGCAAAAQAGTAGRASSPSPSAASARSGNGLTSDAYDDCSAPDHRQRNCKVNKISNRHFYSLYVGKYLSLTKKCYLLLLKMADKGTYGTYRQALSTSRWRVSKLCEVQKLFYVCTISYYVMYLFWIKLFSLHLFKVKHAIMAMLNTVVT